MSRNSLPQQTNTHKREIKIDGIVHLAANGDADGWLKISSGSKSVKVRILNLTLDATDPEEIRQVTAAFRFPYKLDGHRYVTAQVGTMGDVVADQLGAAGISGIAMEQTPAPDDAHGKRRLAQTMEALARILF